MSGTSSLYQNYDLFKTDYLGVSEWLDDIFVSDDDLYIPFFDDPSRNAKKALESINVSDYVNKLGMLSPTLGSHAETSESSNESSFSTLFSELRPSSPFIHNEKSIWSVSKDFFKPDYSSQSTHSKNEDKTSNFSLLNLNIHDINNSQNKDNIKFNPDELRGAYERLMNLNNHSKSPRPSSPTLSNLIETSTGNSSSVVSQQSFCGFCRNNGESEQIFKQHKLKDSSGRVTCPVLRVYMCPICQATGDNAHTLKYCPMSSKEDMNLFKVHETARTSAGKRRPLSIRRL